MTFKLKTLPVNLYYQQLLDFLQMVASEFLLIKREQLKFDNNATSLIKSLEKYLIKSSSKNEWPGTKLLKGKATIYYFKVTKDTITIVKKYSKSLFDWLAPNLLEDISFLRKDGTVVLSSVTHEKEYGLDLTEDELNILRRKMPNLANELIEI